MHFSFLSTQKHVQTKLSIKAKKEKEVGQMLKRETLDHGISENDGPVVMGPQAQLCDIWCLKSPTGE